MAIRIIIVEDHAIVRQGVTALLAGVPDVQVVGEAEDAAAGLQLTRELRPDLVLMDVGLPGMSSVHATGVIVTECKPTRVLAISNYKDAGHIMSMVQAGAMGYVLKDNAFDELVKAIRAVARGELYLSAMSSMLLDRVHGRVNQLLTPREVDVLRLLASGKPMKEAALDLQISTKTVETHRRSIMEKLQLFSVAELTKHAIRTGLTTLD